jgi:hypothetical protein
VQANSSGVFSGTGSSCGGGSGAGALGSDLIYNGAVQVDQTWEGASAVCDGSNNPQPGASQVTETYGPDGWRLGCDSGTGRFNGRRNNLPGTVAGIPNLLQISVTTADTSGTASNNYHVEIPIEGPRIAQLGFGTAAAQSLTCQFWVAGGTNGTYSIALVEG